MKYKNVLCLIIFLICSFPIFGQYSGIGCGIILGEPTGLNFKYWIESNIAMDLGIAWSFLTNFGFQIYSDILYHFFDLFPIPTGSLPLYCGLGANVNIQIKNENTDINIGIRVPIGIAYLFDGITLDVFLEIVPVMKLFPETLPSANAGIGIRYFF